MSGITNSVVTNSMVIGALVTFSKVTDLPFGLGPGVGIHAALVSLGLITA